MQNLEVADKSPLCFIDKTWRNFSGYALYIQVGPQLLQYFDYKVQIIRQVQTEEILWHGSIFLFDSCAFDELQLVEFYGVQRQGTDETALVRKH